MPAYNPPTRAEAFLFDIGLEDMSTPGSFKANPTIVAGDFKISKDNGALTNLATTPTVAPAGGVLVSVTLSAAEMTADKVTIVAIDQSAPKEWADFILNIPTTA